MEMTQNKKEILIIVNNKLTSVAYHRLFAPYVYFQAEYKDEYQLIYVTPDEINFESVELTKLHAIHIHQTCASFELNKILNILKKEYNVKLIVDADDYQTAPKSNPFSTYYNKKTAEMIQLCKIADIITTTTNKFKTLLKEKFPTSKIEVLPNSTHSMLKEQLIATPSPTKKLRVGLIGGVSHLEDLKTIQKTIERIYQNKELLNKIQFVLCGFDLSNDKSIFNIWREFERILTNNYNDCDEIYQQMLKEDNENCTDYAIINDLSYVRVNALNVGEYGQLFNYVDVVIQPLAKTSFNLAKSELRAIEAGTFNKAIIVQNWGAFKALSDNCIMKAVNPSDWYNLIKMYANNRELLEQHSKNLNEYINKNYDIKNQLEKRKKLFE